MIKTLKIFLIFSTVCVLVPSASSGKELTIGVGLPEPFFIEKDESGVFLDIIKEIFRLMPEYEPKFFFMTNKRLVRDINKGWIDAAANVFENSDVKACLSEPVFRYSDVAVTLRKKNFVINKISDLQDKRIATYQGARNILGHEFAEMAKSNPGYQEFPESFVTTNLLVKDRTDVRVGDIFIFLYDINRPLHKGKVSSDQFTLHRLFPDVYTHMAFRDEKICEKFNRALGEIKANGAFEAVYEKYKRYLKGTGQAVTTDK